MFKTYSNIVLIVFATIVAISTFYYLTKDDGLPADEGFLYSAIGCTSVFKKMDQQDKVETMLNLVHHFSARQNIEEVQPGHITQFIKLVEKKWKKENEVARNNCNGIYTMALKEERPEQFNTVAKSVIQYIWDLESKKKDKPLTEEEIRVIFKDKIENN